MDRIRTLAQGLYATLCGRGLSRGIITLGYFGSGSYSDLAEDFDILLIVEKFPRHEPDVVGIIHDVERRIRGDYSVGMPRDLSVPSAYSHVASSYAKYNQMDIDLGIGPANINHATKPWIHLNGPMSLEVWAAFCRRFPIPATIIQNNYTPIFGKTFHQNIPPITVDDMTLYKADMDARFGEMPMSAGYCRKLIKAAAMIFGQRSCQLTECMETLVENRVLNQADALVTLLALERPEALPPELTDDMRQLWRQVMWLAKGT